MGCIYRFMAMIKSKTAIADGIFDNTLIETHCYLKGFIVDY